MGRLTIKISENNIWLLLTSAVIYNIVLVRVKIIYTTTQKFACNPKMMKCKEKSNDWQLLRGRWIVTIMMLEKEIWLLLIGDVSAVIWTIGLKRRIRACNALSRCQANGKPGFRFSALDFLPYPNTRHFIFECPSHCARIAST